MADGDEDRPPFFKIAEPAGGRIRYASSMRIIALLLCACLLGGCSIYGPSDCDALFWAYGGDDHVGDYVWKSLANVGLAVFYTAYSVAYVGVHCASCFRR